MLLLVLPGLVRAHAPAATGEFIENRGQWDARARFAAPVGAGAWLFAEAKGLTYALTGGLPDHEPAGLGLAGPSITPTDQLPAHALRLEFINPQALSGPVGEEAAAGARHYLRGNAPEHWASGARAWQQLRYPNLWPGIDFILKVNPTQRLEYDLLLAVGANPRRIALRYRGAEGLRLDPATGALRIKTSVGELTEYRPSAWQTDPATGRRQPVACAFRLRGGVLGFELGQYDHGRPLTIDPVVEFASYSGARVENWGYAAGHDGAGNLFTVGICFEPGYPTSTGAYQTTFSGQVDVVVTKYNTAVSGAGARVWATYLGGSALEFPHSLVVNARGEVVLLVSTASANYPTTAGAVGRSFRGGPAVAPYGSSTTLALPTGADIVLTRLSADGRSLRASTYLGGSGTDGLLDALAPAPRLRHNYGDAVRGDLVLDPAGNVYVASVTNSGNFPGLPAGAAIVGGSDGLVTSLDSTFSRVRWTTLLGGSGADAAYSLARDADTGNLYAAGGTTSSDLGGRAGGYQPALGGGVDGFVALLTPGGALTQSTYLGTASFDQACFVRLGRGGQPCVLGQTLDNNWPGLDPLCYGNLFGRQFIQQLSPDLRRSGFGTVFGSGRATTDIAPTAFEVDCYGRIFVMGWGGGLDPNGGSTQGLPTTPNAFQRISDTRDFYLLQLSDQARTLDYATFFGTAADDHVDGGTSRFDANGNLYQALCACNLSTGTALPLPPAAHFYASTNGSPHCDNAAFKLSLLPGTTPAGPDTLSVCARAGAMPLGGSPAGGTWTGPGVSFTPQAGYVFTPDSTRLGPNILTYVSPLGGRCASTGTRTITVLPQGRARIIAPRDTICLQPGGPRPPLVPLVGIPAGGVFSGTGVVMGATPGTFFFDATLAGPGLGVISYLVAGGRCPAIATHRFVVQGLLNLQVPGRLVVCLTDPPVPLGGSPSGGMWTGTGVLGSVLAGYYFSPILAGVGTHLLHYAFAGTRTCGPPTGTMIATVRPIAGDSARVPPDTTLCFAGARPFRLRGGTPVGGKWTGAGVTGTVATGFTFTPGSLPQAGTYVVTYTAPVVDSTACPRSKVRRIHLNAALVTLSIANTLLCTSSPPQRLLATPAGGTWTGPGVSGSPATGFIFTPTAAFYGYQTFSYTTAPSTNPAQCPAAGQVTVFVTQSPSVQIDPVAVVGLCQGVPPHGVVLSAQPPGGTFAGPGVNGVRFNAAWLGPGTYPITYTYQTPGLPCPVTASTTITVVLIPAIQLPADTVLCAAQTPFQLRAQPPGGSWSGPGVTPAGVFTPPSAPGTTTLVYNSPGACSSQPYHVTVPPNPTFAASWAPLACADNRLAPRRLRFTATGPLAGQVQWDFGDGSAPATGPDVTYAYPAPGRYLPLATLPADPSAPANGPCARRVALPPVEVLPFALPNIITPNGDQLNDTFAPRLGGCPPRLQVYSRWGRLVFEQDNYQGTWAAEGLASGLYFYLLSGEGVKLKGWVEVLR